MLPVSLVPPHWKEFVDFGNHELEITRGRLRSGLLHQGSMSLGLSRIW
jgi:hypothetical protein